MNYDEYNDEVNWKVVGPMLAIITVLVAFVLVYQFIII